MFLYQSSIKVAVHFILFFSVWILTQQGKFQGIKRSVYLTHGKKVLLEKFLNFFLIETSKNDQFKGGDKEAASALVFNSMCPFTSPKCPFIPRIALLFSISAILFPRISLLFSRSAFSFLKNSLLFSGIVLCLPEVPYFYFLCTSFSKNDFFPVDDTFSLSHSELLREIIFALLLFCFLL